MYKLELEVLRPQASCHKIRGSFHRIRQEGAQLGNFSVD